MGVTKNDGGVSIPLVHGGTIMISPTYGAALPFFFRKETNDGEKGKKQKENKKKLGFHIGFLG